MKKFRRDQLASLLKQLSDIVGENKGSTGQQKSAFEEFLLIEYTNIAQAHFNTVEAIANFVKHYLLIAAVPATVVLFLFNATELKVPTIEGVLRQNPLLPASLLTIIAVVGLLVLGYIVNIRCDTLLYARTVNGIRKYFYQRSGLSIEEEIHIRTLPRTTGLPLYEEKSYFLFVVLAFTVLGTSYFFAGWSFYWTENKWPLSVSFWFLVGTFAWLHVLTYAVLCRYRERWYLRGHIIGIDIDGVLNDHRRQFCDVLHAKRGKVLEPDSITCIPVNEMPGGMVTEDDEHAVFNWAKYWDTMPSSGTSARDVVRKLHNVLGYKVWIFTSRGWPQPQTFPAGEEQEYWSEWARLSWWGSQSRWAILRLIDRWLENRGWPALIGPRMMREITKRWLHRHGIRYDKLLIERGNTHTADASSLTRNRFVLAREREFRAFVEDDLSKAKKLANICEVVFLIDHPYNQADATSLPSNLIRVKSWQELYRAIRLLF